MKTYDLTKDGGWHHDLGVAELAGFASLTDFWPGDVVIVAIACRSNGKLVRELVRLRYAAALGLNDWYEEGTDPRVSALSAASSGA